MPATIAPRPAFSLSQLSSADLGGWNTTTRVLSSLLSDRLLGATPIPDPFQEPGKASGDGTHALLIHSTNGASSPSSPAICTRLSRAGYQRLVEGRDASSVLPAIFPGDFAVPVATTTYDMLQGGAKYTINYSPSALLTHLRPLLPSTVTEEDTRTICSELDSSAKNGAAWVEWYAKQEPLRVNSSMLQWEQALYTGHPLHPMHRSFAAQDPVPHIAPENISSLMKHSISFIAVPGHDVRVTGPYQQVMKSLLSLYGLDHKTTGQVIMPCITMQIPVIKQYHPEMEVLIKDALTADTQSSLRTITLPFSDYDFKFALDVTIGSALRTISSRTVTIVSELSNVLADILPQNMWLIKDVAGITGKSDEFDHSKHISCVVRENLSRKARDNNETLVVTGALQEVPPGSDECNAAIVFNLDTDDKKMKWFEEYTEGIIESFVGPVADYGVAFEAHAQNVLIRMDRATGNIKGWAVRDLGSIKIHTPTLEKSGYTLSTMPPGSLIPTTDEETAWRIIHFCLFHNHLSVFVYRLGIDRFAAWDMIRIKLNNFLASRSHLENIDRLRNFLYAEVTPLKAFMVMKFAKQAANYKYVSVPNVLLERRKEAQSVAAKEIASMEQKQAQPPQKAIAKPRVLREEANAPLYAHNLPHIDHRTMATV